MLLHCPSRKCNTTRDHKLKVDTSEAICMDCGESNNMVSSFMKNAMKGAGDVYRAVAGRKAFMYKCPKCTVDRGVRIVDEVALCESCQHPLNLSAPMIEAIKQVSKPVVKQSLKPNAPAPADDVEDAVEEPKVEINRGVIKRRSE
jgi:ribosomal protein L37AE/L43A